MRIELTILGCGASSGVPRIGNDWGECDPSNPRNRRRRCALLVEKTSESGTTRVLIDTGPDIREQLLSVDVGHVDAVLYTHSHADHLHGIDDVRAFWINSGKRTPVYMDAATHQRALAAFGYCFQTPEGSQYPPILEHRLIESLEPIEIAGAGGSIAFLPVPVVHGNMEALGFRVGGALYLPDVSDIPERSIPAFEGLNCLILDCLRRRPHPSHFCLEDSLAWTRKLAPRRAVFTNLNNDLDYDLLASELPENVVPAYDGMKIQLAETSLKPALASQSG